MPQGQTGPGGTRSEGSQALSIKEAHMDHYQTRHGVVNKGMMWQFGLQFAQKGGQEGH